MCVSDTVRRNGVDVALERKRPQPVSQLWMTVFDQVREGYRRNAGQMIERVCALVQKGVTENQELTEL